MEVVVTTGLLELQDVQSSSQIITTNKPTSSFFYRPDALPVAHPTVSKHWRENVTFHGLAYPKLTWGLPTLSLTTNSSWLPWGGLPCLSSALWCQYPNSPAYHASETIKLLCRKTPDFIPLNFSDLQTAQLTTRYGGPFRNLIIIQTFRPLMNWNSDWFRSGAYLTGALSTRLLTNGVKFAISTICVKGASFDHILIVTIHDLFCMTGLQCDFRFDLFFSFSFSCSFWNIF